jgi:hypothetical protein
MPGHVPGTHAFAEHRHDRAKPGHEESKAQQAATPASR